MNRSSRMIGLVAGLAIAAGPASAQLVSNSEVAAGYSYSAGIYLVSIIDSGTLELSAPNDGTPFSGSVTDGPIRLDVRREISPGLVRLAIESTVLQPPAEFYNDPAIGFNQAWFHFSTSGASPILPPSSGSYFAFTADVDVDVRLEIEDIFDGNNQFVINDANGQRVEQVYARPLGLPGWFNEIFSRTPIDAGTTVWFLVNTDIDDTHANARYEFFIAPRGGSLEGPPPPPPNCSPADLAEPYGVLSQADVSEFVSLFFSLDPNVAALASPFDVVSQADVDAFVDLFFAGCPAQ
ncbi:MAG: hypothetical protein AAFQ71_08990 [Planctomycetota bacterium]